MPPLGILTPRRQRRVETLGSEDFVYRPTAIAASGTDYRSVAAQFPAARKYEPLNKIGIHNDDDVDIRVTVSNTWSYTVYGGVSRTLTGLAVWSFEIENLSSTTATTVDKIEIVVARIPTERGSEVAR